MEARASTILYVSSVVMLCQGMMLLLLDVTMRSHTQEDTLMEMIEWTPMTEWGVILIGLGFYNFLLGLMTDRRGA